MQTDLIGHKVETTVGLPGVSGRLKGVIRAVYIPATEGSSNLMAIVEVENFEKQGGAGNWAVGSLQELPVVALALRKA